MNVPSSHPTSGGMDPQGSAGRGVHAGQGDGAAGVGSESQSPGLDPIFLKREPSAEPRKSTFLLWQYFLFPMLLVAVVVGLFFAARLLTGGDKSEQDLLRTVLHGGENEQQQASQQLAILISEERRRVDALRAKGEQPDPPPFYEAPEFRSDLRRALDLAVKEGSEERQMFLLRAMGRSGDPAAIPVLLDVLYPQPQAGAAPVEYVQDVRRSAAAGLLFFEHRLAEDALARMAARSEPDPEVRAMGSSGLALLALPRFAGDAAPSTHLLPLLREGLDDPHAGVRLNSAYALALRGDPAGQHLIERSLDRQQLQELGVRDAAMQRGALANAVRAAAVLGGGDLKKQVERLTDEANEGDDAVRQLARTVLRDWRNG